MTIKRQDIKKVGILTLPLHINYGGILQAFALQETLKTFGVSVYLINSNNKKTISKWGKIKTLAKRFVKKFVLRRNVELFVERRIREEYPIVSQNVKKFVDKYFQHIIDINKISAVEELKLDAIIVGSDQIWRPKYYYLIENAFLKFVKNQSIIRISYAPSFGTDIWEYTPQQTAECKSLLAKFDYVSVREDSAVEMVLKHFDIDAKHVLDPTMLLSKESYIHIIGKTANKYSGKGITYILDDSIEKTAIVNDISVNLNLSFEPLNVKTEGKELDLKDRIAPPVENWLKGFYEADFVITDSFHACVFSILFNKPFIVIGNKMRGVSRMNSLLTQFSLNSRLIENKENLSNLSLLNFDWNNVNDRLNILRASSYDFLRNALGNEE